MAETRLILGDALTELALLESSSFDAVVTDPPYNVGLKYGSSDDSRTDYREWCSSWFAELRRVCCGPILISCGVANIGMWDTIKKPNWILCWHKPASMGRCAVGFNNWEPVLLYGKLIGQGNCDVFQAVIKPDKSVEGHPCPKPLRWAREQVEKATVKGATVLDPFAGSGTTLVAALLAGREAVGIEVDPDYFAIAERRIADIDAVPPLMQAAGMFDGEE